MSGELWRESATSLAQKIRNGATSAREVAEAHLARISEVNEQINAIVEVRPTEVLDAADAADAHQRNGGALGSLHGVPFTIKTNLDQVGYATTEGTVALKDLMAVADAPTVERMKQAGGVPLARTNMPDVGLRVNTESSLYGACHNPWRRGITAAGSSGGEGAAIASGMSPIGLGNDIGGSVSNPAYANGIASIKPTRGRVPQGNPSAPMAPLLNAQVMLQQGVMARHVADVRLGLQALMGAHHADPQSIDVPYDGRPVSRRVAVVVAPEGGDTHPGIQDGVRRAADALSDAGYQLIEVAPPRLIEVYLAWSELMINNLSVARPLLEGLLGEGGRKFLELTNLDFGESTPESQAISHQTRYALQKEWRRFFSEYPLILGPTWTQPPFAHGFDISSQENAFKVVEMMRFILPANLFGLPAACVPTGVHEGLPTGAQLIGDMFREDLCLAAAEAVEARLGVFTPIDPRP